MTGMDRAWNMALHNGTNASSDKRVTLLSNFGYDLRCDNSKFDPTRKYGGYPSTKSKIREETASMEIRAAYNEDNGILHGIRRRKTWGI
jgi:hypothetical protein